jgi:hypothetical protein
MSDERVITLEDRTAGWGTSTAILSPRSSFLIPRSSLLGDAVYDLQGRRLSEIPSKGLYIQNGKKKVAK